MKSLMTTRRWVTSPLASFVTKPRRQWLHSYRRAVMRDIDTSLPARAQCMDSALREHLDFSLAQVQHEQLHQALKSCGVEVDVLPSDGFADSVFIEDTAVVIGNRVLITNPGASSRQGETKQVLSYFQSKHPQMEVIQMKDATLDGGDVLYTGSEILVGLSQRTNIAGLISLQFAFPHIPVYFVEMQQLISFLPPTASAHEKHTLHLKSFCSVFGPQHQVIVGGDLGKSFAHWLTQSRTSESDSVYGRFIIHPDAKHTLNLPPLAKYQILAVPDRDAANCVYVNQTLLRRAGEEFPKSDVIFKQSSLLNGVKQIEVCGSELAKVDGALTCCSLLF